MRELDELLNRFLMRRFSSLCRPEQEAFIRLLDYPDDLLLELLMGRMAPADKDVAHIVQEIRNTAVS
jgi:antitoxin CptB